MQDSLMYVLQRMMVLCRDNGKTFTVTDRLDAIAELLRDTPYHRAEADALCHLYAQKPLSELPRELVLVSAHADCEYHITKCFAEDCGNGCLLGTFDNGATDAAAVWVMREKKLPEHVVFAFTGDEEENGRGAVSTAKYLKRIGKKIRIAVVTDVTDVEFDSADFTVENDFFDDRTGRKITDIAVQSGGQWKFVPGEPDDIPDYVPKEVIVPQEAAEDESWDYDELDVDAFSYCVPVRGDMHSNAGVLMHAESFALYTETLSEILRTI